MVTDIQLGVAFVLGIDVPTSTGCEDLGMKACGCRVKAHLDAGIIDTGSSVGPDLWKLF